MRVDESTAAGRVLGWDVLRGLCAVGVATYHLLMWQGVAEVYPLGSYGVYLFFVLSGASLAYNYTGKLSGPRDVARFLFARWMRLAPLLALVCVASIVLFSARHGAWVDHIPQRLAMNLTFAFGLTNPLRDSLAIGGWSLGIEAVYYLALPLMLWALGRPVVAAFVAIAVVAAQAFWIHQTVGAAAGYDPYAYHQAPGFVAYFFFGCVLGRWRRRSRRVLPTFVGMSAWAAMALLLVALDSPRSGDELTGWRGVLLASACIVVVFVSGHARIADRLSFPARWLGDITYGCYLLHPLLFFGFAWFVMPALGPADVTQLPLGVKWMVLVAVVTLACALAAASEKWFERPLRQWARGLLRPHERAGYIDASSIAR